MNRFIGILKIKKNTRWMNIKQINLNLLFFMNLLKNSFIQIYPLVLDLDCNLIQSNILDHWTQFAIEEPHRNENYIRNLSRIDMWRLAWFCSIPSVLDLVQSISWYKVRTKSRSSSWRFSDHLIIKSTIKSLVETKRDDRIQIEKPWKMEKI